ncbi:MAG TPA: ABC transporter substrate-binding protein [Ramlibacter sp.]|jgi:ABC-type branched-subunit amino acid transport system substrate-binding protein|uniref:ABC transporter substrate-binding protein n=1 Tax=Ramlibacter sp. TaxID=1917967 RepID=UPI002D5F236D|nr:ABC transporter substrate-binding protein [Ramlibacter sp.]HZY19043.1 ABC transporter substrate-binding protein [Ramlibacter sp.]
MTRSTVACAAGALAWLVALAPLSAAADIVLGHSGDLTGISQAVTKDYLRGMNAYFDELNRKGGIRGEKIKLVSMDDAFNPDKTVENTKELIDRNVLALVGYRGTANVQKIIPVIQAAGIAEIGNTSGAKSLRDPHVPNLFHVRASTTDEVEAAVNHAWTIGVTRIAAAYQDDAFGKESLDAMNVAIKKRGGAPVAIAPVPRGTVDVAKAVEVIAASNAQAVFYFGQAKPAAALINGIRAKGSRPQFIVTSVASGLHAELKEASAGVIVSQVVPYPFTELGNPVVKEYQATMAKLDESKPSYNSMEGFLNAKVVATALQKTPPPLTRAKLIATLESLNNEDMGGFSITYGKQSNLGSRFVALTMIRADGSFAR